jgi:septal ring factor EnvC (AmiA/AmiB activator)
LRIILKNGELKRILFIACLLISVSLSQGQEVERLKSEREKTLRDIAFTDSLLSATKATRENKMMSLRLITSTVKKRQRIINGIGNEVYTINSQINENQKEKVALEQELELMKEEYGKIIYRTWLNRNAYHRAQYLLASEDFNQAYKRLKYLEQYGRYRKKQAGNIMLKTEELKLANQKLAQDKMVKDSLLAVEKEEVTRLNVDKKEQERYVKSLQTQEKQLKRELENRKAVYRKLENEIARIMAAATGSETSGTGMKMTPEMKLISDEFSKNNGRLPWPVERGVITLGYGVQDHPVLKKVKIDNKGIEIATGSGAPVFSVFNGKVSAVMTLPGGARAVLIQHGEYFSVYKNLGEIKVKEGQDVKTRQEIGRAVRQAAENNTELHFEIWKTEKPLPVTVDPENWLSK